MNNFQFISDLLATDVMVYTTAKKSDHYVLLDIKKPHGHPTLFMESSVGSVVNSKTESFVKKTFESGKREVGAYGVMIAGRPTQQVVYPIYHYKKIIAVLVFEKANGKLPLLGPSTKSESKSFKTFKISF